MLISSGFVHLKGKNKNKNPAEIHIWSRSHDSMFYNSHNKTDNKLKNRKMTLEIKNLYQQETSEIMWCHSPTLQISKQTETRLHGGGRGEEVYQKPLFSHHV